MSKEIHKDKLKTIIKNHFFFQYSTFFQYSIRTREKKKDPPATVPQDLVAAAWPNMSEKLMRNNKLRIYIVLLYLFYPFIQQE